jgi:formate--tetrahydrofolate ligase
LADWVVTEAGFGCDLGAEKFIDLKCAATGLNPSAVVLVATVRALKMHGGVPVKALAAEDAAAVARGLPNLEKHLETIAKFGKPAVVAINRFPTDTEAELQVVADACEKMGVAFAVADHFTRGAAGAEALARAILEITPNEPSPLQTIYQADDSVSDKIAKVAKEVYGADGVQFTAEAQLALRRIARLKYDHLPICMAKTQSSLSDDPKKIGRPTGFEITVRDIVVNGGAEFLVVLTGGMLRMPGLPKKPQAAGVRLVDGEILGVG